MKIILLQVGKSYVNRRGEVKTITRHDDDSGAYSYLSGDGLSFTPTGVYQTGLMSQDDLISEYKLETADSKDARIAELEAEITRLKAVIPEPVVKSLWRNVTATGPGVAWTSRRKSDLYVDEPRIAVLRVDTITAPDGTVTYHAELEKV